MVFLDATVNNVTLYASHKSSKIHNGDILHSFQTESIIRMNNSKTCHI